ncbi:MAG: hypothetical protein ABW140_09135 [Candidatus Sedimenticola sp. 6PFRAG1]
MSNDNLNILILCNRPTKNSQAATVFDHLDAFQKYSTHNIFELSTIHSIPSRVKLDRFDVIVIHYTLGIGFEHYLNSKTKSIISTSNALKVVFIQDEYRVINDVTQSLIDIGADIVFTCVPEGEIEKVYLPDKLPKLTVINNLCGYVPEHPDTTPTPLIKDRPIDVGYRSRKMPYWLGTLGVEKWRIVDDFKEHAKDLDLVLDLSYEESDRIYGDRWPKFLASCKAVLGVESGSSVFDFTGDIQHNVEEYMAKHPNAEFEEVFQKFLKNEEGKIKLNQISPRAFETAALKTLMVLYEGDYSNILIPWKHYVPLKKDFSNFDEVIEVLNTPSKAQKIVDAAYQDLIIEKTYSYERFISLFDNVLIREFNRRDFKLNPDSYTQNSYKFDLYTSIDYLGRYMLSSILQKMLLNSPPIRKLVFNLWFSLPINFQKRLRPYVRIINK